MRPGLVVSLAIGGLALGLGVIPVSAQQAQSAEPPRTAAAQGAAANQAAVLMDWVKLCQKGTETQNKELCLINYEAIDANSGVTIVGASVRKIDGDVKERLTVTLPQTALLALPSGVRVNVDEGKPVFLAYTYCYIWTCEAQAELTTELLSELRKGKQLMVAFVNLQGQASGLPVNLTGFTKAYDGPSVDATKYQEGRAKVIDAMRQRQAQLAAQAKQSQAAPSIGEGPSPSQPQPVYPEGPPAGVQP
jgi:invasion protein IalB